MSNQLCLLQKPVKSSPYYLLCFKSKERVKYLTRSFDLLLCFKS